MNCLLLLLNKILFIATVMLLNTIRSVHLLEKYLRFRDILLINCHCVYGISL